MVCCDRIMSERLQIFTIKTLEVQAKPHKQTERYYRLMDRQMDRQIDPFWKSDMSPSFDDRTTEHKNDTT